VRRLLVALVVCGLLVAVSASLPADAQQAITVTLSPTSAPGGTTGTWSIAVTGTGFAPNRAITAIEFASVNVTPSPPPVTDGSGRFTAQITPARRWAGSYQVLVRQSYCTFSACFTNTAEAFFRSIATIALSPECHRPGQSQNLTVTGDGWPANSGDIGVSYDGLTPRNVSPQPDSTFSTVFTGLTTTNRDIPVVAQQFRTQETARATWPPCPPTPTTTTTTSTTVPDTTTTSTTRPPGGGVVTTTTSTTIPTIVTIPPPTPGAALLVTPSLGPGGFVTTALGSGFPANQPVTLGWSPGIGIYSVTAGPDGTFVSPVLVMNRDVLGPRTLVATSGEVSASASFLVVPSTVQPSGKDVAQITRVRRFLQR
jgi:hypothetical protein